MLVASALSRSSPFWHRTALLVRTKSTSRPLPHRSTPCVLPCHPFLIVSYLTALQTPFTFDTQIFLEVLLKGVGFPGTSNNTGEVASPLPLTVGSDTGELRLQSDFALARDPRTACFWQGFVNEQQFMMASFKAAMSKLAILGHNRNSLIDCSDVVPAPKPPVNKPASFPATTGPKDLQLSCPIERFPSLSVDCEFCPSNLLASGILTTSNLCSWYQGDAYPPLL